MPEKVSQHLLDRLAEIQDPRNNKAKRHPLKSILGLNIIAFMTGHPSQLRHEPNQNSQEHSVGHTRKHLVPQQYIT